MKKQRTLSFLFVALLALVVFAACNTNNNDNAAVDVPDAGTSAQDNQAQTNDIGEGALDTVQFLNLALGEEPRSIDASLTSEAVGGTILTNIREPLTRIIPLYPESGYMFEPAGARSWESNADGTVWTFHLNNNYWEDGVPVTAHDYVFSMRRTVAPETGAPLSFMLAPLLHFDEVNAGELPLESLGVRAIDDMTLEISLTSPVPFFMNLTTDRVMMPQREDIIALHGERYGSGGEFTIANGPFRIESWNQQSSIVLVRNEHYWDSDNVRLDTVTFHIMTDATTRHHAFEAGEIDIVAVTTRQWRDHFYGMSGVIPTVGVPTQTITYAFFNTDDELFQNENIRRAFMIAIDRVELNEVAFDGFRIPTYGWIVPSISVGEYNFREHAGDPIRELQANHPDPRELLIQGMQELGLGDDPSTLNVTFNLAGTDEWFRTLGEYLQQIYSVNLGVNMQINFAEWGIFFDNVQNGNFQIGFMGWGAFFNEPFDVLNIFMSETNAVHTGWANAEFDELINRAMVELDEWERLQLYIQAERILIYDEAAVMPLATTTLNSFRRDFVRGVRPSTFGDAVLKYHYTSGRP
ncbi:MAG: peptide ABC transporter substrate-binding protein [Defluviitaleaceae bacterium]|nr:peptide ABC transporter substrate-binding protein [Defluviitaleaceae bacterium]